MTIKWFQPPLICFIHSLTQPQIANQQKNKKYKQFFKFGLEKVICKMYQYNLSDLKRFNTTLNNLLRNCLTFKSICFQNNQWLYLLFIFTLPLSPTFFCSDKLFFLRIFFCQLHKDAPIEEHPGNLTIFCHNTLTATAYQLIYTTLYLCNRARVTLHSLPQ